MAAAAERLASFGDSLVPADRIPDGDETNRLHRWGYHRYRELFNDRQLLGLQLLEREIGQVEDKEVRFALATVFSDMLRYPQGERTLGFYLLPQRQGRPIIVAILDAGLTCTATLASPAEMTASLHINGTGSSTVDTIFVCRKEELCEVLRLSRYCYFNTRQVNTNRIVITCFRGDISNDSLYIFR